MTKNDPNDGRLLARIRGSADALRKYLTDHPAECERVQRGDGLITVDLLIPSSQFEELARLGLRGEVLFDAGRRSRELRRRVGVGNRFAEGRIPQGLGLAGQVKPG